MRSMRLVLALLVVSSGTAIAAPQLVSQSTPHPGIHRETWVDSAIPARIHLVRLDLTSAELALYATKESNRGITTSGYADLLGAQVAINGDAFAVAGYRPRGLAIGDSTPWTNTMDDAATALLHMRRVGERTFASIEPPEVLVTPETLPSGTQGAIAGRPLLVRAGVAEAQPTCDDPVTLACTRAPRTAVAVSADGNRMWLAVVDGWQQGSSGMTARELGEFLAARGGYMALGLDGGGASTLVIDGTLVSSPSDGVERSVANHLAVKYGALPKGQLVGFICKEDIFTCGTDTTKRISGAQVTLDDGRVITVGADGFYNFLDVTPRLACVTVKKAGYKTTVQCKTVSSQIQTYNSVVLVPGVDMPDAGVPDAGSTSEDAGVTADAGVQPDAGTTDPDPAGCCDTRGDLGGARTHLLLVAFVAWMLTRRRGTKA